MSINIIAACDLNRGIGFKNQLLCKLKSDMQYFKKLTTGQIVLMGRKTLDSIGKPLPNRTNLVLTRNQKHQFHPEISYYNSVEDVIEEYNRYADDSTELFIIGGGKTYKQFLPYASKIYLTVIQYKFNHVDAFFPEINISDWNHRIIDFKSKDENNEYDHFYVEYIRK
ncbi:dihydrofolate reductase [Heyndrickxia camelliae]|uniref:Dihydrofolate reductase n=1 Tax=Heyndrickxia camelliae TaxID=1707093 RepID=A0A2N3LG10_9BACI|nr:dihydrofolate reductase [Heyndrickxia camelliae]PKR83558.1 hypothetical protein CWO92_18510 [Heyndrickxia camelliae]